jgi:membrane dipeptidase
MLIFDGHLDLAYNALSHERDPLLPVGAIRRREADPLPDDGRGSCTTSLHEMREAGVAVAVTTVLARCKPWVKPGRAKLRYSGDWPSPAMAYAVAQGMLAYYRELQRQGHVRLLETARDLDEHWQQWEAAGESKPPVGLIVTMEGADPIVDPGQLQDWHDAGLRTLLLTHFGRGRYAAGNPSDDPANPHDVDGPVTALGVALLREMDQLGMPLDLTHCSDTTFWDALKKFEGRVYSSHTNGRALAEGQRQFSDEMIRAVAERGGVLGVVTYFGMIRPGWREKYALPPLRHEVTLADLADHVDHIAQLTGSAEHVAIGSDLDGGYGREEGPNDLDRHRDLHRLGDILRDRGWSGAAVAGVMYGNWRRFFGEVLPA